MFKSFPRVCSYDNAAVSKLVHMKVQKYRKAVKKKKSFYGQSFIKQGLQSSRRCLCSDAAHKVAAVSSGTYGWEFPKELLVGLLPEQGCLGILESPTYPDSVAQEGKISFRVEH